MTTWSPAALTESQQSHRSISALLVRVRARVWVRVRLRLRVRVRVRHLGTPHARGHRGG